MNTHISGWPALNPLSCFLLLLERQALIRAGQAESGKETIRSSVNRDPSARGKIAEAPFLVTGISCRIAKPRLSALV